MVLFLTLFLLKCKQSKTFSICSSYSTVLLFLVINRFYLLTRPMLKGSQEFIAGIIIQSYMKKAWKELPSQVQEAIYVTFYLLKCQEWPSYLAIQLTRGSMRGIRVFHCEAQIFYSQFYIFHLVLKLKITFSIQTQEPCIETILSEDHVGIKTEVQQAHLA